MGWGSDASNSVINCRLNTTHFVKSVPLIKGGWECVQPTHASLKLGPVASEPLGC